MQRKLFKVLLADSLDENKWSKIYEGNEEVTRYIERYALANWGDKAKFIRDDTLVGGYWINEDTGDAIIIEPND